MHRIFLDFLDHIPGSFVDDAGIRTEYVRICESADFTTCYLTDGPIHPSSICSGLANRGKEGGG